MTFTELLVMKRIPFRRHASRAGELYLNCPFCGDERFRFSLNSYKNLGHCFNCDWKSQKAIQFFLRQFGITVAMEGEKGDAAGEEKPAVTLPEDFTLLHTIREKDGPPLTDAVEYAERRGLSREQMKRWQVGLSVIGKYGYRIIFPVIWRGKLRMFIGRDWTGTQKPKYLNSVGDKFLWNMPKKAEEVHLCEGIVKAIALENAAKVKAVSTLGSDITDGQIKQLKRAGVTSAVIWADPDVPGQLGAVKIANNLSDADIAPRIVYPVPEKQLDELTPDELRGMRSRIRDYSWTLEQRLKMARAMLS